jgi:DedD protein
MPQTELAEPIHLSTYKHRILGAILLVSLGVIFIPVFLNGTPPAPHLQRSNIPPRPKEPAPLAITEPSAAAVAKVMSAKPGALTPVPAGPKTAPTPKAKTESTASTKQWAIQMASFFTADNAQTLLHQLQQAGFKAYMEKATVDNNNVFRVYVGPAANRHAAEQLTSRIQQQFHIEGIILEAKAPHRSLVSNG